MFYILKLDLNSKRLIKRPQIPLKNLKNTWNIFLINLMIE